MSPSGAFAERHRLTQSMGQFDAQERPDWNYQLTVQTEVNHVRRDFEQRQLVSSDQLVHRVSEVLTNQDASLTEVRGTLEQIVEEVLRQREAYNTLCGQLQEQFDLVSNIIHQAHQHRDLHELFTRTSTLNEALETKAISMKSEIIPIDLRGLES